VRLVGQHSTRALPSFECPPRCEWDGIMLKAPSSLTIVSFSARHDTRWP
jgi:hypothetical protein